MKKYLNRLCLPVLGIGLMFGGSGCLTSAVWSKQNRTGYFKPATNSQPALYHSPQRADVLVVYDEQINQRSGVTRRAYYLFENNKTVAKGSSPKFVSPKESNGLTQIPILPKETEPEDYPREMFAISSDAPYKVTLYYDGGWAGEYMLPRYEGTTDKWARIVATPITVAVDGALVLGASFMMAGPEELWNCGAHARLDR